MKKINIAHEVRARAGKIIKNLSENAEALFKTPQFAEHLSNMLIALMGKGGRRIGLEVEYDFSPNSDTAYTDGGKIHMNVGCPLVQSGGIEARYKACLGMLMHEVGHVQFCDFDTDKKITDIMEDGTASFESRYARITGKTLSSVYSDPEDVKNIQEMGKEEYASFVKDLYNNITNAIIDPHDEGKMMDKYGEFVAACITLLAGNLQRSIPTVDTMKAEGRSDISIAFSLLLQFVRFGEINVVDFDDFQTTKEWEFLQKIAKPADKARWTDNPYERAGLVIDIMVKFWPMVNKEKQKGTSTSALQQALSEAQQQSGSTAAPQGVKSSATAKNNTKQAQQSSQSSQQSSQNGQQSSQSGQQSSQNGQQGSQGGQQSSQSGQQGSQSGQQSSQSGQQSSQSGQQGSQSGQQGSQSGQQGSQSGQQSSQNGQQGSQGGQNTEAQVQSALQTLIKQVAKECAENETSQAITKAANAIVKGANMSDTHANYPLQVINHKGADSSQMQEIDNILKETAPYRKRLIDEMRRVLKEMREGDISHHRQYGRILEAQNAYRPDERYFAKKNLPKDVPNMALTILIDESGSMSGTRLAEAKRAATILFDFARTLEIPCRLVGHNTSGSNVRYHTYTDFDSVSYKDIYSVSLMHAGGNNRDGAALTVAGHELMLRDEETKLLLIISDGQPNHDNYGGEQAAEDLKSIVRSLKRKHVQVVTAAIGSDKENIKEIYGLGSYLDISDLSALPKALTKIVKRQLIE